MSQGVPQRTPEQVPPGFPGTSGTPVEPLGELLGDVDAAVWEAAGADPVEPWAFTMVSDGAARLAGFPAARWLEPGFWAGRVDPADRGRAAGEVRAALADGKAYAVEYRVTTAGGETRWVRETGRAAWRGGTPVLRGLVTDVTESREHEAWLERTLRSERELTGRLRALNELKNSFLTAVSHDMRTPLSAILGIALTLQRAGGRLPAEDVSDLLGRVVGNARKLDQLLRDLLDLDRLHRGMLSPELAEVDLAALVRRVAEEATAGDARQVELDLRPAVAEADAAKVERIVDNLVRNALRHTPPGTPVWVRTRPVDGGVQLVVEDAGPGVPREQRAVIFEPFRQAEGRGRRHGTGVGLSLVAQFAGLHGGRAWVQERQGGGASFRVFLPAGGTPGRD